MRIRNYALTLLLAVLAGTGLALREHETIRFFRGDIPLAFVILLAGLIAWLLFYFMDEFWYHRLLLGAVRHAVEIEKVLGEQVPGIGLTQRIGDESPIYWGKEGNGRRHEIHSTQKIRIFYWSIGAMLMIFAVLVLLGAPGPSRVTNPSPTPSPSASVSPSVPSGPTPTRTP